jgi:hypothetical protein
MGDMLCSAYYKIKSFHMMTAKDIYQKALALKPQEQAEFV